MSEAFVLCPDSISKCQECHLGEGVTHVVVRRRRSIERALHMDPAKFSIVRPSEAILFKMRAPSDHMSALWSAKIQVHA